MLPHHVEARASDEGPEIFIPEVFLNEIDQSCSSPKAYSGPNKDLVAILTPEIDMGDLEIHNVYNPEKMNTGCAQNATHH